MNGRVRSACGIGILVSFVAAGCAARQHTTTNPFVKQGKPIMEVGKPVKAAKRPGGSRQPVAEVRPASSAGMLPTLEASDAALAAALLAASVAGTPDAHVRVAERYRQLGILDLAHDHFLRASELDRRDAPAYEGLARILRDWGFPQLGVADASRAVYYAPSSASAHNTLGTLLAAVGHAGEARREYQRAVELDPRAAYALNNLCYLSFVEGDAARALGECRAALSADPGLTAARTTLDELERREARDSAR